MCKGKLIFWNLHNSFTYYVSLDKDKERDDKKKDKSSEDKKDSDKVAEKKKEDIPKGQLISDWLFVVLNFPKNNKIIWLPNLIQNSKQWLNQTIKG